MTRVITGNKVPTGSAIDAYAGAIITLLEAGFTCPKIARKLGWDNDEALRLWLIKHPALNAMRLANGKKAKVTAGYTSGKFRGDIHHV